MKNNIFEKLYGYLFRSLAKSILSEFDRNNKEEYLTIGILLYKSYDESFYYAPTLKNSLIFPNEISPTSFPTSKKALWDEQLMLSFGRFLSQPTIKHWVNELFEENIELSNNEASSYATTFDAYKNFRDKWKEWFNTQIDIFTDENKINLGRKKDALILNQLFHFGNYLITIKRNAAYISKSSSEERTNAENIYMIISNREQIKESNYFDIDTGVLKYGNDLQWKAEPRTQERRAKLNFALEVCYRWPFSVEDKIKVLNSIYGHRQIDKTNKQYKFNATATPLIYNGEFLGICYVSQSLPDTKVNFDFKIGRRSETLISKIKQSSITSFLYSSRFETARLSLQKINADTYKKSSVERIFEISHIFSSSPLVCFIDEVDSLFCRFRQGGELVKKMSTTKSNSKGIQLINFLRQYFSEQTFPDNEKESYTWFDVNQKIANSQKDKKEAFEKINNFNSALSNILSPSIIFNPDQLRITSVCFLKYEIEGAIVKLIYFNSNFDSLSNSGISNSLVKKSYALRNHNYIRQLIEAEQVQRRLYEQSLSFQENIRKGLLHYFKGSLTHKIKHYLENKITKESQNILLNNCDIINERLINLINIYNKDFSGQETELRTIYECWNECLNGYDKKSIALDKSNFDSNDSIKCICNKEALIIIFEEQIQNAFNVFKLNSKKKLRLQLKVAKKKDILLITVNCYGSNMQTKYIEKAGIDSFSSPESSGIGFIITELLLYKSGALKSGKRHFDLKNSKSPKCFKFIFKLNIP